MSRRSLTIKEKVDLLEQFDRDKCSIRQLSKLFKIGKTQAADILKRRDMIMKEWMSNKNESKCRLFSSGDGGGGVVDKIVFEWFSRIRTMNIPVSGPMIQGKALEIAKEIGHVKFKASNGWLAKFRTRHNISFKSPRGGGGGGESATKVNSEPVVIQWEKKLPSVISGYTAENIFNADETGLLFRALPVKSGDSCATGKMKTAKESITVLLCTSMSGEKEPPLIIGKAAKPRSFKNFDVSKFNVEWKWNEKALMTTEIMTEWLLKLDRKMGRQDRNILLFLDNVSSHPDLGLKRVKLIFFPRNVTSLSQPLHQGVIQNFKMKYRQLVVSHLILKRSTGEIQNVQTLVKELTLLDAIVWISSAWKQVEGSTITKCFHKAGFKIADACEPEGNDVNSFEDLDALLSATGFAVTAQEYLSVDSGLITESSSVEIPDLIAEFAEEAKEDGDEQQQQQRTEVAKNSQFKTYFDVIRTLDEMKEFYIDRKDEEGFKLINDLIEYNQNAILSGKHLKQKSITDFFRC